MGATDGALDIVLLGPAGAGKGTQARLISSRYGLPHVASGDLLRAHRAQGSPLGQQASAYMDRGELVPDELVIGMILERLRQPDARRGVLLDGFPRNLPQSEALDQELEGEGRRLRLALYLKVPQDVLIERAANRWTCPIGGETYNYRVNPPRVLGVCDVDGGELYQREDDRVEVIAERIRVYLEETAPVIDYYRRRGILRELDGTRTIEEVGADIEAWIQRAAVA